jgi:DNA repair exonuclease SbcCD ATPase subunit
MKGARGQGTGGKGSPNEKTEGTKGKVPDVEALYKLPLSEFIAARNALAGRLKKAGKTDEANRVKALNKPSAPAWAVNQLYWEHRDVFDRLIASGDRLRKAQAAKLAGQAGDIRGALDALREALSALTHLAADRLRESGSSTTPDQMRRVTSTLEALASIGVVPGGPEPGRLADEVDPPGFETLAALVPSSERAERGDAPTRVLTFQQAQANKPARGKPKSEDDERRQAEERKARLAAAKAQAEDAERALKDARATAQQAQADLKKAAAYAKDTEQEMIEAEQRLEKIAKEAHSARQTARRLAVEAETAAQAVEDAERSLARAKEALSAL